LFIFVPACFNKLLLMNDCHEVGHHTYLVDKNLVDGSMMTMVVMMMMMM